MIHALSSKDADRPQGAGDPVRFVEAASHATLHWLALADWLNPGRPADVQDASVMLPADPSDEALEALAVDLSRITRIGLVFGKWVDGRGYSLARLLRRRYHFAGELRATGEVLVDMLPLLVRCGVDAVVLREGQRLDHARRALSHFADLGHYQGDVPQPLPRFRRAQPPADAQGGATPAPTVIRPGQAIALYAKPSPGHARLVAATVERLQAAAQAHPGRIVFATSLGAEDMVLLDLIARHRLPVAVGTLLTGRLHAETLELLERAQAHVAPSGVHIERHQPDAQAVLQWVDRHGLDGLYRSVELRKGCCAVRKLEPLSRLLAGRSAWVTGLRREQSDERAEVPWSEVDATGRTKFNPLADWRWGDVWHYLSVHGVPFNALHDAFMPSIGCAPCTRAIAVGEPFRAGRWWWEQASAKECGLHPAATVS